MLSVGSKTDNCPCLLVILYLAPCDVIALLIRPYWRCYYSNTDAIIYVVDSSDRDRMGISKSELVAMLEVKRG